MKYKTLEFRKDGDNGVLFLIALSGKHTVSVSIVKRWIPACDDWKPPSERKKVRLYSKLRANVWTEKGWEDFYFLEDFPEEKDLTDEASFVKLAKEHVKIIAELLG